MPEPLKSHFDALDAEIIWLHGRWKIYRQLFGTSPKRIDILNESARGFFLIIQNVLGDNLELTLSNLADRASTAGKKNLTLESLLNDLRQLNYPALYEELEGVLSKFKEMCKKVRHRRNKQLAHSDLKTLMSTGSNPIPGASREEIEDALLKLRAFMNALLRQFADATTAYEEIVLTWDGDVLLSVLKQGLRYHELVKAGTVPWDDLRSHSKYSGI